MQFGHTLFYRVCTPAVEVFVRKVLNDIYNIVGELNVKGAAKVLLPALDGIKAMKKNLLCDATRGFCRNQYFPAHISHFYSKRFQDPSMYEMGKRHLLAHWSETHHWRFPTFFMDTSLSVDCGRPRVQ